MSLIHAHLIVWDILGYEYRLLFYRFVCMTTSIRQYWWMLYLDVLLRHQSTESMVSPFGNTQNHRLRTICGLEIEDVWNPFVWFPILQHVCWRHTVLFSQCQFTLPAPQHTLSFVHLGYPRMLNDQALCFARIHPGKCKRRQIPVFRSSKCGSAEHGRWVFFSPGQVSKAKGKVASLLGRHSVHVMWRVYGWHPFNYCINDAMTVRLTFWNLRSHGLAEIWQVAKVTAIKGADWVSSRTFWSRHWFHYLSLGNFLKISKVIHCSSDKISNKVVSTSQGHRCNIPPWWQFSSGLGRAPCLEGKGKVMGTCADKDQ